jgi:hypothetical protein
MIRDSLRGSLCETLVARTVEYLVPALIVVVVLEMELELRGRRLDATAGQ